MLWVGRVLEKPYAFIHIFGVPFAGQVDEQGSGIVLGTVTGAQGSAAFLSFRN